MLAIILDSLTRYGFAVTSLSHRERVRVRELTLPIILSIFIFLPALCFARENPQSQEPEKLKPIKHIIVFFLENHSFDNLFGTFPGANGLENAKDIVQVDENGKPYQTLPAILNHKEIDKNFPLDLPNQPFLISKYAPSDQKIGDPVHRFYQLQNQINGGKSDKFVVAGNSGGLPMGYYEEKNSPLWQYAQKYTLADNFFTAAFGGSLLNHIWLICACTPYYPNPPQELLSVLDDKGNLIKDAPLTPDGYAVNTIKPVSMNYDAKIDRKLLLPLQNMPTIGDRLNEKNIDWAWYSGGWNNADSGKPDKSFIYHHQPFTYFSNYAIGSEGRKKHLKDEEDFTAAIASGTLPAVSFYKPIGKFNLHPGYTDLKSGEEHVFNIIKQIENSKIWQDSLIIVTFDDAGGFFDHVAPPKIDRFGPGSRVPTIIISPYAKSGFIDNTLYDTTSILKLIETKFALEPLGSRDAGAGDLLNALK